MDIEELSKGQLLLLTILVNFVMSVATGIVTVSLLDQASPTITQTVNRIVEQTVQTVAPSSPVAAIVTPPAKNDTQSQPSEQQQVVSAISTLAARTVTISTADGASVVGVGTYLPKSRAVVTAHTDGLPAQALITFANGSSSPVSLSRSDTDIAIYGFSDSAALPAGPVASLVASSTLKQGLAVLGLTGDNSAVTGIVSKVTASTVTTTLPQTPAGTAAVDLSGAIIGINTGKDGVYENASAILQLLTATSTP